MGIAIKTLGRYFNPFDVGLLEFKSCLDVSLLDFSTFWWIFIRISWQHWTGTVHWFKSIFKQELLVKGLNTAVKNCAINIQSVFEKGKREIKRIKISCKKVAKSIKYFVEYPIFF